MSTIVRSLSALAIVPVVASTATTEPPSTAVADASPGLAEMVAMVPATSFELGSRAQLYYVDMSLAWERIGAGADPAERAEHIGELPVVETFSMGPQLFGTYGAMFDEARAEIGFTLVEIERELAVLSPPNDLFIDATSVSADVITGAMEADAMWSPDLTTVETDHGPYFSWGDGTEPNPERISPLHPLGRGGQLAVLGDGAATTIRTFDSADMEAVLETSAGRDAVGDDVGGPRTGPRRPRRRSGVRAGGDPESAAARPGAPRRGPRAVEELLESDQLACLPRHGRCRDRHAGGDEHRDPPRPPRRRGRRRRTPTESPEALESGVDVATMQPLGRRAARRRGLGRR